VREETGKFRKKREGEDKKASLIWAVREEGEPNFNKDGIQQKNQKKGVVGEKGERGRDLELLNAPPKFLSSPSREMENFQTRGGEAGKTH